MQYSALLILFSIPLLAGEFINLSANKENYIVYEPVYIEFEYDQELTPNGFKRIGLDDDLGLIQLQISDPKGIRLIYEPLFKVINTNWDNSTYFNETLLLHGNSILTEEPGIYSLVLLDSKNGNPVSNRIEIRADPPHRANDIRAVEEIRKSPMEYGMFITLRGSDRYAKGKEIVEFLAAGNSDFSGLAKALIAMNEAQTRYDYINNKVLRQQNIGRVESMLNQLDSDEIPRVVELQLAVRIMSKIKLVNMPKGLENRVRTLCAKNMDRIGRNTNYKRLGSFMN